MFVHVLYEEKQLYSSTWYGEKLLVHKLSPPWLLEQFVLRWGLFREQIKCFILPEIVKYFGIFFFHEGK